MDKDTVNGLSLQLEDTQREGDGLNDLNGKIIGGAWLFANRRVERIELAVRALQTDAMNGASHLPETEPKARK